MTINPQSIPPELARQPQPQPPEEVVEEAPTIPAPEKPVDELAGLFEVPKATDHDIATDDLIEVSEEDVMGGDADMSDLVDVSNEDVMGKETKPKNKSRQIRRTNRRYIPPLSMGGMNL